MILNKRTELYYTSFSRSVNGKNDILHSFFTGAGRTPFQSGFCALGWFRAGAGCDAAADRLKATVLGQRALLPYVPLRFHPSESMSARMQPAPVRDHPKVPKNGFEWFVGNAMMELE